MAFPGNPGMLPGMDPNAGMSDQERQMVKMMQAGMESCVGKTAMAGVMGGGLGAMFGLFMASMRYDTPMSQPLPVQTPTSTSTTASTAKPTTTPLKPSLPPAPAGPVGPVTAALPTSVPLTDLPLRQQLKHGLRDMYQSSKASGRNFAVVGSVFSGTECAIEGLRAKNDLWNGVAGGCITGGVLARKGGPQAVAVGCAGFAAFSLAIDAYMRMPEDERSRPIA
ncbi:mitochondrial import inner membrane translocase, subunit Tim17/22 [Lophiostoma macrostomum CBS 122681]|uniref:Mitochondrial import inner membrane translocase subunit TIM22 n=1 Tax=Lophiostoma macrostomum CBS 122681 TaxID=1314788 RepID=A0A6A6SK80_9PLEO|nr:mitochondrial import inner membrane translocase, subunit Tim17/22 [Lophiostoma macrostomum CBS 122681]